MPIKFIANSTPARAVNATLEVDDEDDLTLYLNGVKVLYLDSDDGAINRFYLNHENVQRLQEAGIKTDDDLLRFET